MIGLRRAHHREHTMRRCQFQRGRPRRIWEQYPAHFGLLVGTGETSSRSSSQWELQPWRHCWQKRISTVSLPAHWPSAAVLVPAASVPRVGSQAAAGTMALALAAVEKPEATKQACNEATRTAEGAPELSSVIAFAKLHGCGNDYVVVDARRFPELNDAATAGFAARSMSPRHTGIGSDGLLLVGLATVPGADWRMRIFNADGGEATICGNGLRCTAKWAYETGLCPKTDMQVQTGAGIVNLTLRLRTSSGCGSGNLGKMSRETVEAVRVDIGVPRLRPEEVPTTLAEGSTDATLVPLRVLDRDFLVNCVSVGNPHVVILNEDEVVSDHDLYRYGSALETHAAFPEGVNVNFVTPLGGDALRVRTWERGSGATKACGSGACASAVAWRRAVGQAVPTRIRAILDGGELCIEWAGNVESGDRVFMEGGATFVFSGEWFPENAVAE
eukprot:TRINITY_DN45159_c0_g1_i1.p1 TRINITY_DN45159_c0_g1~~TRINITY_DN45159_c0_g1_i1.p1  ORF type:complete len:444 (+),score=58.55 TRINITY_DN45159_c0_g1_i1:34-1365(+)